MRARFRFAVLLLVAASAAACDDQFGVQPWDATPDTITLFSLSRTDLIGKPSAYDFANRRHVEVEQPGSGGNWDFALGGTSTLELIPAPAFQGQANSRAAIASIGGTTFEALLEAPADTARYTTQPVTLSPGAVYVVRTRRTACGFSATVKYGKVKAVSVDPVAGSARFAVVVNPYCNDRSFVPPED